MLLWYRKTNQFAKLNQNRMSTIQEIEQEMNEIEQKITDAQKEGDVLVAGAGQAVRDAAWEQLRTQIANLPDEQH